MTGTALFKCVLQVDVVNIPFEIEVEFEKTAMFFLKSLYLFSY